MKQKILSSLLDRKVQLIDHPFTEKGLVGLIGIIRSVYLDLEGDPKYTVEVVEPLTEKVRLMDLYESRFCLLAD